MSERINAYATPTPDGGFNVDFEGMAVDLITICEAGGMDREGFFTFMETTWDEVVVTIDTTNVKKQS